MIYALIATVVDAVTLVFTKRIFGGLRKLDYKAFVLWVFVFIALVCLVLSPWLVKISPIAITPKYLLLLLAMVIIAANHNMLYYFGLRYEKVSAIEPFLLFSPIITILIAGLFYPAERFWEIYVAAAVAGIMLFWEQLNDHKLKWDAHFTAVVGFAVLYAFEVVIVRQLLNAYSPVGLYLVRAMITALFLWMMNRGQVPTLPVKQIPYFLIMAGSAVLTVSLTYFSYKITGISDTVLIFTLSPVLVYWLSWIFLKDKITPKNAITSIVVLGLVIWVTMSR